MAGLTHTQRVWLMQGVRAAMFAGIILAIHLAHAKRTAGLPPHGSVPLEIDQVLEFYPTGATIDPFESGVQVVRNTERKTLGYVLQTSPEGEEFVGYSGPTNVLIAFNTDETILGIRILESADTWEHVAAIQHDSRYRFTWNGTTRDEASALMQVDAVSGSTLTSLAVQQAIQKRLGTEPPNLKFPDLISLEEVQAIFPEAARLEESSNPWQLVMDSTGETLGRVIRSSPWADRVNGYQGPTDVLMGFDAQGKLAGFRLRQSYDNDPYVGYVRAEDYFLNSLNGKTLQELAELDLIEEQVEGVSGATMTSLGVADTLIATAQWVLESDQADVSRETEPATIWSPARRDYGTLLVLCLGLVMAFTNLRGVRSVRVIYQLLLIGYLGLLNGDMVSQAFLVGAARHGLPWRSAFGISVLSLAALMVPLLSRRQVYCHQLCPHGALQQMLKGRLCTPKTLPRRWHRGLLFIPVILLGLTILVAIVDWPLNLAAIEPFDAWLFRVAGASTICIAVVGLLVSCVYPMAYCRYGCPTGAMLGFLRKHAKSDRWSRRDSVATGLLLLAWGAFAVGVW